jgi:hypothetical protein
MRAIFHRLRRLENAAARPSGSTPRLRRFWKTVVVVWAQTTSPYACPPDWFPDRILGARQLHMERRAKGVGVATKNRAGTPSENSC